MTYFSKIHNAQLLEIIKDVKIHDKRSYTVGGKKGTVFNHEPITSFFEPLSEFGKNSVDEQNWDDSKLASELSNRLYSYFYCGIKDKEANSTVPLKTGRSEFIKQLSENNKSTTAPSTFWQVYTIDANGNAFAHKNGVQRYLQPGTYVPADTTQQGLSVNSYVHIIRKKEQNNLQAVFYYLNSDSYFEPDSRIMRIYWNTTPEGAPVLVKEITTVLNEYKVPFSFKCLNHPDLYVRNDSAVLYFDKMYQDIILLLLKDIIPHVKPYLKKEIPWFTESLYNGISIAEDPMNGESFGMSRTKRIAEALIAVSSTDLKTDQEKLEYVQQYLAKTGVNKEKIFLNTHTSNVNKFIKYEEA